MSYVLKRSKTIGRRVAWLLGIAVLFLSADFLGTFLFTRPFLAELEKIHGYDDASERLSRIGDNVIVAVELLANASRTKKPREARDVFFIRIAQAQIDFREVRKRLAEEAELQTDVADLEKNLRDIRKPADAFFAVLAADPASEDAEKITHQYDLLDIAKNQISESVSRIRTVLRRRSDAAFRFVYEKRHRPVIVGTGLTLLFAALVIALGSRFVRQLNLSIGNLLALTESVAAGDLDRRAPVVSEDEMGWLTRSFNNMTESLKTMRVRLVESEKMTVLGKLAGVVSHELRNPLNAMQSSLYYIESKSGNFDEKIKKHLGILKRATDHSNKIIGDILGFARVRNPELAALNINHLVRAVLSEMSLPPGVRVRMELGEDLPDPKADAVQLTQVFGNIVNNAVEALGGQGELLIRTFLGVHRVEISFTDDGPGIEEEHLKKVFEPLFSTKAKGTGLGLAVCQSLVRGHGGEIDVKSRKNHGTTFTVRLPINPVI